MSAYKVSRKKAGVLVETASSFEARLSALPCPYAEASGKRRQ